MSFELLRNERLTTAGRRLVSGVLFSAVLAVLLSAAPDMYAQLEVESPPQITITPDGGSHTIAATTYQEAANAGGVTIEISVRLMDHDGLNKDTLSINVVSRSGTTPVLNTTWTGNESGTFATVKGSIQLIDAGTHVVTAKIKDKTELEGSGSASFSVTYTNPSNPIVSLEPHHQDYRNTTIGAATLSYATPPYTSMSVERSASLRYDSEQADPTAFVQFNVTLHHTRSASFAGGRYTLMIVDPANNNQIVVSEETFKMGDDGFPQRIAVQWSMRGRATGAYNFRADVRAYQKDATLPTSVTHVPVRILVVNHANSRYGSGWSLAGIQRIHSTSPTAAANTGLLLEEGNGVAWWFEKQSCSNSECTYRTPEGDFTQIVYNRITDQWKRTYTDGTVATFSGRGFLKSVISRIGRATHYDWHYHADASKEPLLAQITDPAMKATSFAYHWGTHLGAITDPLGRKTEFWYEGATSAGLPINTPAHLSWIGNGVLTISATYDATHRLSSYTDASGTTDVDYDAFGKVASIKAPAVTVGGASERPTTKFTSLPAVTVQCAVPSTCTRTFVNANAVATSTTDAGGHTTTVSSDRYGNPLEIYEYGVRTMWARYYDNGLPLSTNTPRRAALQTWNARGQLLTHEVNGRTVLFATYLHTGELEYANSHGRESWYQFDEHGKLLKTWFGSKSDYDKNATTYEYDGTHRLIKTTGPKGEVSEWSYDGTWLNVQRLRNLSEAGIWRDTTFTYDTAGRPASTTDPVGRVTTFTYDSYNRPLQVTQGGRTLTYGYTGPRLTSVTVPGGKVYSYAYNALGWLERETFPDGKFRTYAYNVEGLVTSRKDRRSSEVTMEYDASHRLTSRCADGRHTTFSYPNPHANLTARIATNDELQESIDYHTESGELYRLTYKLGDNMYFLDQAFNDGTGWEVVGLDVNRWLVSGVYVGGNSLRWRYEHDASSTTLSSALHITNIDGNTTTLQYDASGRLVKTKFPTGLVQDNVFDKEGQRTSTSFNLIASLNASYTYDALGRLRTRTTAAGDQRRTYDYDTYGQLSSYEKAQRNVPAGCKPELQNCASPWTLAVQESYTYDLADNRTDRSATLDGTSNRYRTFDGYTLDTTRKGTSPVSTRPASTSVSNGTLSDSSPA